MNLKCISSSCQTGPRPLSTTIRIWLWSWRHMNHIRLQTCRISIIRSTVLEWTDSRKVDNPLWSLLSHYSDGKMSVMASPSPASRLFAQPFVQAQIKENIKFPRHPWPVDSPHKRPVTRKMLPLDDVIMGRFASWQSLSTGPLSDLRCFVRRRNCVNLTTQPERKSLWRSLGDARVRSHHECGETMKTCFKSLVVFIV